VDLPQPNAIPGQVIRDGRIGLEFVYGGKQQVFGCLGPTEFVEGVGTVNPAEAALRRQGGQRRGDVQASLPFFSVGVNPPPELEDIWVGAVGRADLFQLVVGRGVIA